VFRSGSTEEAVNKCEIYVLKCVGKLRRREDIIQNESREQVVAR
jgi:hypothetical protein